MNPFRPFVIGSLELPNHLIMAPVKTGYITPTGEVTESHEAYYWRRAQGDAGAIIVKPFFISPVGKEHPKQLGIPSYDHIKELQKSVGREYAKVVV